MDRRTFSAVIFGIGGIGWRLTPELAQFLNYHYPGSDLTLVDGDEFHPENADRQRFPALGNKAAVATAALKPQFPEIIIRAAPVYATVENIVELVYNGCVVFGCVDNHVSRKIISDGCENLADATVISGGNQGDLGGIQTFIRRNGKNLTLPLANDFRKEIKFPQDRHPNQPGCQELGRHLPQLSLLNNIVAALMLGKFYELVIKSPQIADEAFYDISDGNYNQICRS